MSGQNSSKVASIFIWAVGCMLVSIPLTILFLPAGLASFAASKGTNFVSVIFMIFGPAVFLVGLILTVVGLGAGFKAAQADSGPKQYPRVQVRSRFAVNSIGEMIFSNFEYDAPGGELFVQILLPTGDIQEVRTAWAIFNLCGEGMWGAAVVEGDWLSSFRPIIGRSTTTSHLPDLNQPR